MAFRNTPNSSKAPINVVGSSVFGRYRKISSEMTYNMSISDGWLVNFAGWKKVLEILESGSGRGVFRSIRGDFVLVVVNSAVYRIATNLSATFIGNLSSSAGEVFIDENLANQICIVDGVNAYIYNHSLAPNLTIQSLSGSLVPNYVTYHNTYFLFGNGNQTSSGANWYVYRFDTATTIVQEVSLSLITKPDRAIAVKRIPGQANNVLVFGTSVCEVHTQIAGLQVYQRNSTLNVDYGCLNVSTIAESDEYIAWLGVNEKNAPAIMVYSGQGIQQISSDGISYVMQQIEFPQDSTAMMYRIDGHLYYQLTFYNAVDNITLVYDFNEKVFLNLADHEMNYHPARDVVYFNGGLYFISLNNASMYAMSTNYTTYNENIDGNDPDLNNEIPRIRICANLRDDDSEAYIVNQCVLTIEQGYDENYTGLSSVNDDLIITEITLDDVVTEAGDYIVTQYSSDTPYATDHLIYRPRVDLSLSYDGGITFGSYVSREMNPVGIRKNQMTWEKMGAANDLVLKFRFVGTSRFVVNNSYLEVYS